MKKFEIICTPEKSAKLFFGYRYITVNKSISDQIGENNIDGFLGKYQIRVGERVLDRYADSEHYELLKSLNCDNDYAEMMHPSHPYKLYMRCLLSLKSISIFKKLFVSTMVYMSEGMKCPTSENFKILFDSESKTATITDLVLHTPENNPYYKYTRNAASMLSTEAIGLDGYKKQKDHNIKNFYDSTKMTHWKPYSTLKREKKISDMPGIYMLYDSAKNEVYIGKAKRLKERIEQHKKNPDDYMRDFTHYRYTTVCDEYFEFLYLIENAAIHDVAQIVDMVNAKKYTSSLASLAASTGNSLDSCRLVNKVECQTKKQS